MRNFAFLVLTIFFLPLSPLVGKESPNQLCNIRGYEIIFPYEKAINEIKNKFEFDLSLIFRALIPILGILEGSSNQTAVGITPGDDVIFGISIKIELISF